MTNAEKTKVADIAAGAQVNVIETVDGHFSINNRQLQLNNMLVLTQRTFTIP